jgi:two-component sensor histidine kinase
MKKLLFISLVFLPTVLYAKLSGQALIDSILKELPDVKMDTNKVRILRKLGKLYEFNNPGEGVKYAGQSLELAEQLDWKKGMAAADDQLAGYCMDKSDFPKALEYDFKALKINEERGAKDALCITVGNIGNVYVAQNNYPKALEYFFKALKMSEELGDKEGIAANLTNMGIAYHKLGKYDTALAYDIKALKSYKEQRNKDGIIAVTTNIGTVYHAQKNYSKAIEYFLKSLKLNESIGNKRYIAGNLGNIGDTYLSVAQDTGGKMEPDNQVMAVREASLDKAIEYLGRAIALSKEIGITDAVINFEKDLADAYSLSGRYKEALETYKEYHLISDSVYSTDSKIKIANITAQHEADLKNKQIEINRIQKINERRERTLFITGIGLLLLFIVIVIRNYEKQKRVNNLLEKEKAKSDTLMRNLQELLYQKDVLMKEIHHRVKNNLQVITTLLDLQLINITDEHAKQAITESTARVRSISLIHQQLYQNESVNKVEFARFIKDLLQQITTIYKRHGQNIYLKNEIAETKLDIDTAIPLGLILNELITNSFKYAFPNVSEGGIDIKLERTAGHYQLTYSDGGAELPVDFNPDTSKTLGMRVMKSLSKQLGGEFVYDKDNRWFGVTFKDEKGRKSID